MTFKISQESSILMNMEKICGVDRNLVRMAAIKYASASSAMEFHGLGVTEHWQGTKAITLILNIAHDDRKYRKRGRRNQSAQGAE